MQVYRRCINVFHFTKIISVKLKCAKRKQISEKSNQMLDLALSIINSFLLLSKTMPPLFKSCSRLYDHICTSHITILDSQCLSLSELNLIKLQLLLLLQTFCFKMTKKHPVLCPMCGHPMHRGLPLCYPKEGRSYICEVYIPCYQG